MSDQKSQPAVEASFYFYTLKAKVEQLGQIISSSDNSEKEIERLILIGLLYLIKHNVEEAIEKVRYAP